ncbi:MAG: hypothetical protein U0K57_00860 [Lachnospiraceae bacterium]|nr:hypothetical protein [Lachnospiraceae bacterium]
MAAEMTAEQLIEEIEVYIDNARSTGVLGSGGMIKVNREEILAMLEEVRNALPREIEDSRRILKTKDSILAEAKAKADRIVSEAGKEAEKMVDSNEIVSLSEMRAKDLEGDAQDRADAMLQKAREDSRAMQLGALSYTQEMMDGLEGMYASILEEEKKFFDSVIAKIEEDHKHILRDKREVDLQLGVNGHTARSREEFEKQSANTEEKTNKEAQEEK